MTRRNGFFRVMRTVPNESDHVVVMGQRENEKGFSVCEFADGGLTHGPVAHGTPTSVQIPIACPPGSRFRGMHHTHPGGIAQPSATDIRSARRVGADVLCIDADGDFACFQVRR